MGLFNHFPYTNFHDLNLGWAIEKIEELITEGETLYTQLQEWKTDTDADLTAWKADTLHDIEEWEQTIADNLEGWKTATVDDFEQQFTEYQTAFNQIKNDAEGYMTDAQTAAGQAADSALAAAQSAEAAEAVEENMAQLEQDVEDMPYRYGEYVDQETPTEAGGFTGDVGSPITLNTTTGWYRMVVPLVEDRRYKFTFTNKADTPVTPAYIKTTDENGTVLADYDVIPQEAASVRTVYHNFSAEEKYAYVRSSVRVTLKAYDKAPDIPALKDRVSTLENDVDAVEDVVAEIPYEGSEFVPGNLSTTAGGFSGNVGSTITLNTTAGWYRMMIPINPDYNYKITFTNKADTSITAAYIKTTDQNGTVLADYDMIPQEAASVRTVYHKFSAEEKYAYVRSSVRATLLAYYEEPFPQQTNTRISTLKKEATTYHAAIPAPDNYSDTTFTDIYAAYDALCSEYPEFISRAADIGEDSDGNAIRMYTMSKNRAIVGDNVPWTGGNATYDSSPELNYFSERCPLKHALLNAGTHGDEKASVWALYRFCKDYLESQDQWCTTLLSQYTFSIIPVLCPWGYNNNSRNNKNDVNVNRDYNTADADKQPETLAITTWALAHKSDLYTALDMHTTSGNYGYISTRKGKQYTNAVMKIASDVIMECVRDWDKVAELAGLSSVYHPYAYGCLAINEGTFTEWFPAQGITIRCNTIESIDGTGIAKSYVGKFGQDMLGNMLLAYLKPYPLLPLPTSGSTSDRPSNAGIGFIYFDTTIDKNIIMSASGWTNLDGSAIE